MIKHNNAQIIRTDQKPPTTFRNTISIETPIDVVWSLSTIPLRVMTVQDIRSCYQCKIGEIGDFEIRETYDKLCVDEF